MTRPCSIQNKPIVGLLVGSWWLGEWLKCIWEESTLDLLNLQCINNLLPTVLHCEPLVVTSHYLWWRLGLVFVTSWQARDGVHWPDSLARRLSHWNAILQNWYKAQNTIVFLRGAHLKLHPDIFNLLHSILIEKQKRKQKTSLIMVILKWSQGNKHKSHLHQIFIILLITWPFIHPFWY